MCKIFGRKIRSCKFVEKSQVCSLLQSNTLFSGVYEFTATINAETYDHRSTAHGLRPAAWAIVKEGEEDKVVLKFDQSDVREGSLELMFAMVWGQRLIFFRL